MYGQTEASPRISFSCSRNKSQSIFSVGKSYRGGKIIVKDLIPLEILALDVLTIQLSNKYTRTKIISVMKKIFM